MIRVRLGIIIYFMLFFLLIDNVSIRIFLVTVILVHFLARVQKSCDLVKINSKYYRQHYQQRLMNRDDKSKDRCLLFQDIIVADIEDISRERHTKIYEFFIQTQWL